LFQFFQNGCPQQSASHPSRVRPTNIAWCNEDLALVLHAYAKVGIGISKTWQNHGLCKNVVVKWREGTDFQCLCSILRLKLTGSRNALGHVFFLNFQHRLQRKFNHRRLSPWMFIARYDSTSQLLRHSSRAVWVGLEWWGYHIVTTFQATQATNQLIWNLDKLERPHFDIIRVMRIALVTIPIEATISG
jgi:hypothetical protein